MVDTVLPSGSSAVEGEGALAVDGPPPAEAVVVAGCWCPTNTVFTGGAGFELNIRSKNPRFCLGASTGSCATGGAVTCAGAEAVTGVGDEGVAVADVVVVIAVAAAVVDVELGVGEGGVGAGGGGGGVGLRGEVEVRSAGWGGVETVEVEVGLEGGGGIPCGGGRASGIDVGGGVRSTGTVSTAAEAPGAWGGVVVAAAGGTTGVGEVTSAGVIASGAGMGDGKPAGLLVTGTPVGPGGGVVEGDAKGCCPYFRRKKSKGRQGYGQGSMVEGRNGGDIFAREERVGDIGHHPNVGAKGTENLGGEGKVVLCGGQKTPVSLTWRTAAGSAGGARWGSGTVAAVVFTSGMGSVEVDGSSRGVVASTTASGPTPRCPSPGTTASEGVVCVRWRTPGWAEVAGSAGTLRGVGAWAGADVTATTPESTADSPASGFDFLDQNPITPRPPTPGGTYDSVPHGMRRAAGLVSEGDEPRLKYHLCLRGRPVACLVSSGNPHDT